MSGAGTGGHRARSVAAGWTDERVEKLKGLHAEGLSASQMAKALAGGATRNAVIGKCIRLGLSFTRPSAPKLRGPSAPREPRKARPNPTFKGDPTLSPLQKRLAVAEANARVRLAAEAVPPPEGPGLATMLTLGPHMCKWPIGDPQRPDFSFCGQPFEDGPYCAGHAQVAYAPAALNKRDLRWKLKGAV